MKNEVEGMWSNCVTKCRKCGSILIECPREGHVNSHYWELERPDGLVLKVCPNSCLESDATEAFRNEL